MRRMLKSNIGFHSGRGQCHTSPVNALVRPQCCPVAFSPSRIRLRYHAKAMHGDQKFAADLKDSAFAIRRLACIIVMLDETKIDLNPNRRERIEREVIALWQSCI
jgi:hypothetical protein